MKTAKELVAAWDRGEIINTIELGGLGPGYEQAIQIAAVEFTRACMELAGLKPDDKESTDRFRDACNARLKQIDSDIGGLSGAQYCAAEWLAWKWCTEGPQALIERAKKDGKEDRITMVSKHWPKAPEPPKTSNPQPTTA